MHMLKRTVPSLLVIAALALAGVTARPAFAQQAASIPVIKRDIVKKIEAALPDKAPAQPKQPRKILIFSKTNGYRHASIPVGVFSLTVMGRKTGAYEVVYSEDDAWF